MTWAPPSPIHKIANDPINNNTQENTMNSNRENLIGHLNSQHGMDTEEINAILDILDMERIVTEADILVTYTVTVEYSGVPITEDIDCMDKYDLLGVIDVEYPGHDSFSGEGEVIYVEAEEASAEYRA